MENETVLKKQKMEIHQIIAETEEVKHTANEIKNNVVVCCEDIRFRVDVKNNCKECSPTNKKCCCF